MAGADDSRREASGLCYDCNDQAHDSRQVFRMTGVQMSIECMPVYTGSWNYRSCFEDLEETCCYGPGRDKLHKDTNPMTTIASSFHISSSRLTSSLTVIHSCDNG